VNRLRTLPLVFSLALALPAIAAARQDCPWLNAATAGGLLDGEVTSATQLSKTGVAGSCDFTSREGSATARLFIQVVMLTASQTYAAYQAQCGPHATPLKTIGNEAVLCPYTSTPGESGQQVVGRVRNHAFLVRLTVRGRAAPAILLQEKIREAAEQIAGSLF